MLVRLGNNRRFGGGFLTDGVGLIPLAVVFQSLLNSFDNLWSHKAGVHLTLDVQF